MQFGPQIPKLRCVCNFHVNMQFNNAHLFYLCVVLIIHDVVFCICWAFANHCNCICANKIFEFNLSSWYHLYLIFLPDTAPEMFYFLISTETTINAACYFGRKNIAAQLSSGIYIKRFSSILTPSRWLWLIDFQWLYRDDLISKKGFFLKVSCLICVLSYFKSYLKLR